MSSVINVFLNKQLIQTISYANPKLNRRRDLASSKVKVRKQKEQRKK